MAVGGERAAERDSVVGIHHFPLALESDLSALFYSLVPLLLWAALRLGSVGVSTSMVIVAVISVWGAVHGHGPFVGSDPQHNALSLLLFLLFASTLFLLLAALVEERERASLIQRALSRRLISAQEQERRRSRANFTTTFLKNSLSCRWTSATQIAYRTIPPWT